jgi:hypothetical protein
MSVTVNGQQFTIQSVTPSWYYRLNDECGMTGSGKRDSVKYMDAMFKSCVIKPAEVTGEGISFFDKRGDLKTAENLIKAIEAFMRELAFPDERSNTERASGIYECLCDIDGVVNLIDGMNILFDSMMVKYGDGDNPLAEGLHTILKYTVDNAAALREAVSRTYDAYFNEKGIMRQG